MDVIIKEGDQNNYISIPDILNPKWRQATLELQSFILESYNFCCLPLLLSTRGCYWLS